VKNAAQEFWAKIVSDYVPLSAQRVPTSAKMRLKGGGYYRKGQQAASAVTFFLYAMTF